MGQTTNSESCSFCKVWVLRLRRMKPLKVGFTSLLPTDKPLTISEITVAGGRGILTI